MERSFTLPITIAAALHAGLLFGIPKHSIEWADPDNRVPPSVTSEKPFEIDLTPPEASDASPALASSVKDAMPAMPEPPPVETDSHFQIPIPQVPATVPNDHRTNVIGFRGPESGDVLGKIDGTGKIFNPGELDAVPRARLQGAPQYPHDKRREGAGGEVLVEFTVDESGAVSAPRVVRSSDRSFEEPTLRAVVRWRFEPGRREGHAVRFRMAVPVRFKLDE